MDEILHFMSQCELAAINTYPSEEAASTQPWTWTQLKAEEKCQEQRSREGRSSATPTGLQYGHTHITGSGMGTSEKADSFRSPAGDHEAGKTRRTLEGNPSELQPESGNRSHQRKPHTTGTGATAAALRARFLQQSRIRRGGDGHAGAVHHDDVTALEGQTQKSRGKTRLGRDLKGEATGKDTRAVQARAHNLHNPRRKTARQELIKTQRDLQGEEERPHGKES